MRQSVIDQNPVLADIWSVPVKQRANPAETHPVWDYTTGEKQPATAYVRPGGGYVVVNDETGQVVQVSDVNNPNWKPVWNDPRFQQ